MSYFGHRMRHDSFIKTVIQGYVVGKRIRGRPRKNWMNNIMEWSGSEMDLTQILQATLYRDGWRRTCVSAIHIPPTINRSR